MRAPHPSSSSSCSSAGPGSSFGGALNKTPLALRLPREVIVRILVLLEPRDRIAASSLPGEWAAAGQESKAWHDLIWPQPGRASSPPTSLELQWLVTNTPPRSARRIGWPSTLLTTPLQRAVIARQITSLDALYICGSGAGARPDSLFKVVLPDLASNSEQGRRNLRNMRGLELECTSRPSEDHIVTSMFSALWARTPNIEHFSISVSRDAGTEQCTNEPGQPMDIFRLFTFKCEKPNLLSLTLSAPFPTGDTQPLTRDSPLFSTCENLTELDYTVHTYPLERLRAVFTNLKHLRCAVFRVESICETMDTLRFDKDLAPWLSRLAPVCSKHLPPFSRLRIAKLLMNARPLLDVVVLICPDTYEPEPSGLWPATIHPRFGAAYALGLDLRERKFEWEKAGWEIPGFFDPEADSEDEDEGLLMGPIDVEDYYDA